MDNVFEILIYGLIIISFISSFFKKKKKQQQAQQKLEQMQKTKEYPEHEEYEAKQEAKREPDLLKDLEDFFKVGTEEKLKFVEPKPAQPVETELHESFENFFNLEEKKPSVTPDQTYTDPWKKKENELQERVEKIDSKVEEQAAKFEATLKRKKSAASEISKKIKQRLQEPTSLKDYIIISEIMGKPKSLNR